MSEAVKGLEAFGGAAALGGAAFVLASTGVGAALIPFLLKGMAALAMQGVAMEAGALANALTANRGSNISIRQPAANVPIVLGMQRVGGVMIYASTTGSKHDHYHRIIVLAGHSCHSILNLYLDGRKVYWQGSGTGYAVRNGVGFGGWCDGNDHIGPDGSTYNFNGNLVYAEARFGDQLPGDVMASLTANDGVWTTSAQGAPYVGGCTYIYLQISTDQSMFPREPEIRVDLNGKDDIYDPRTGTKGFTTNNALLVADRATDPLLGLGMDYADINEPQLIAAANVCDERIDLGAGGTEARYSAHWKGDTSVGPADVIVSLMAACAGRMSLIGGQWYIWPAYWQGPSFDFDKEVLLGDDFSWEPYRTLQKRFNRVNGTYTAANYPYNAAGNLYDANGWWDGTIDNTFQFGFQSTNYPQFAMDSNHGYPNDAWLEADGGNPLPKEVGQPCVLSVAQCQRVGKINLMRNRYEGTGTMSMCLAAWGLQPTSVMRMDMPQYLGWNKKLLEVSGMALHIERAGDRGMACWLSANVQETGSDIYEWSTAEEQTVYAVPAGGLAQVPWGVAPPTGLALASATSTGNVAGLGGNATNFAIAVSWIQPADALVTQIEMQAKLHADVDWYDGGTVSVASPQAFIYGVNKDATYDVRIRSLRSNGAYGAWVEVDGFTVTS